MYQLTGPLNYCRPSLVDGPNQGSPVVGRAYPTPISTGVAAAQFRAGDFLALTTTGTLTYPNPNGSIATVQPTALPTVAYTVTGSTPLTVLYYYYTYLGSGSIESLPSPWFTLVIPAGNTATITVPTANGAPAAATAFALYMGYNPYQAWQQVATTNLGSAASVPNPLTNYQGAQRAATNASANILGLALDDYDVLFTNYQAGPSQAITTNQLLFGGDQTSLDPEQYQTKFAKLTNGQQFVISLLQPFSQGQQYKTGGLNYETAQNVFVVDTAQSNKIITIVDSDDNLDNWPASQPFDTGLVGAQVRAIFNAGVLA